MNEDFQLSGNTSVERDILKIAVIIGAIEDAVSFNMRAEIFPGPIASLASSEQIKLHVFSSESKMFSGQEKGGTGRSFKGGVNVLKFFEKLKLSSIALEAGDESGVPLLSKSLRSIKLGPHLRLLP